MNQRVHRLTMSLVPALALVLLVGACGAGSSSTAASAGSGSPSAVSTSAAASTASDVPAPAGDDAKQFCAVVKKQVTRFRGTELPGLLNGGTPAAWKAYFKASEAMNQQLVDTAPAEIRDTVKTLQATALAMKATLAAAGYDASKVGAVKLMQAMRSAASMQASTTLTTYVSAHCGLDLTKPQG